jgi:hypothetical protein
MSLQLNRSMATSWVLATDGEYDVAFRTRGPAVAAVRATAAAAAVLPTD